MTTPIRQVRAAQTASTLTVYQAYSPAIARPALEAGRFVAPFKCAPSTSGFEPAIDAAGARRSPGEPPYELLPELAARIGAAG